MNQKEATEIVVNYLTPLFSEKGYLFKKSKWKGFVKQYDGGFDYVNIHFYNYWPIQQPGYGIARRFDLVEQVYNNLVDVYGLNKVGDSKTNETFYFSYESLNDLGSIGYLKGGETEQEMLSDAKKIEDFMLDVGFPMLEKYDLKTIDAEINGDDFWETDWMHKFTLGGGFHFKRMIIAKLCGNKNFNKLFEFHQAEHEEIRKKNPDQEPKKIDGKRSMEYLVEVLLKDVKAI